MTQQTAEQPASNLATPCDRLYAFLLDFFTPVVVGIVIVPLQYIVGEDIATFAVGIALLAFLVVQFMLVAKRSQTLGKHLLNIYVVDTRRDARCGFWRFFLMREFVGKTLIIGSLPVLNFTLQPLYLIVDSLFIFRKDRRTVHDMIARTAVRHLPEVYARKKLLDFTEMRK